MALIANVEMAAAWDGDEGDRWSEHAEAYERCTRRQRDHLLARADLAPSEDVLDVGCGTGALTRAVARECAGGSTLGVDLSGRMVALARDKAVRAGLTNAEFEQADAEVHAFTPGRFDRLVSSFGTSFFGDPRRAFTNLADALRPGGTVCMLAWRELSHNEWVWVLRDALAAGRKLPSPPAGAPGPFGLADRERTREVLAQAGLAAVEFEQVDEVNDFGRDADEAWAFVKDLGLARGLLADLDQEARIEATGKLQAALASRQSEDGVLFSASAWLITARRP